MTQIQTLANGGQLARLTATTAIATGTVAEIQAVLDAAERSGRLDGHDSIVPLAGQPGAFMVNVRLRPPARQRRSPVMQSQEVVILPRELQPERGRLVGVQRRTKAAIGVASGSVIAVGVAGFVAFEVWTFLVRNAVVLLGGAGATLVVLFLLSRTGRKMCSGVHIKH